MYDSRAAASEDELSRMTAGASATVDISQTSGQADFARLAYPASAVGSITNPQRPSPQNSFRTVAGGSNACNINQLSPSFGFGQPTFTYDVSDPGHVDQGSLQPFNFDTYATNAQSQTFQYDVSWPGEDPRKKQNRQDQQQQENQQAHQRQQQHQQQNQHQHLNHQQELEDDAIAEDDDDEVTKLLATRMGSLRIAEDGQLRYYGPTSNLHVQSNGWQSLSQSTIRQVAVEGSGVLQRLGIDQEVPLDLEDHLARLYFAWEDPAIHVADEESFFKEKQRHRSGHQATPYYSETLNNAM